MRIEVYSRTPQLAIDLLLFHGLCFRLLNLVVHMEPYICFYTFAVVYYCKRYNLTIYIINAIFDLIIIFNNV